MFANKWHRNYLIRRYLYGPALNAACRAAYWLRWAIPARVTRLDRPIFALGCSRSGTTVFIELFRGHTDLCDWSEGAQIFEPRYYDAEIDHVRSAADATPEIAFRIRFLLGLKARLLRRSRVVNKHPENALRLPFLAAIFPDAVFIHIVRDGLSAVESNLTRSRIDPYRRTWPFGQFPKPPAWRSYLDFPPVEQFAHQWADIVTRIRADAARLPGTAGYIEIAYEDLCDDPRGVIAAIDRQAGLDPARRPAGAIPERLRNGNGRWRDSLSPDDIAAIRRIIGTPPTERDEAAARVA